MDLYKTVKKKRGAIGQSMDIAKSKPLNIDAIMDEK